MRQYTDDEIMEHRRALVEALRSGRYKQGVGKLRTDDGCFCCLGVAEDLNPESEWREIVSGSEHVGETAAVIGVTGYLTESGRDWLGVKDENPKIEVGPQGPRSLAALNDNGGWSFERIADALEATDLRFAAGHDRLGA